jgi:hypothetical protein
MKPNRLDTLARAVHATRSRRGALTALLGGTLGLLGLAETAAKRTCIRTGRVCPAKDPNGKPGAKLGCDKCCQGGSVRSPSARRGETRKRRCCIPFGQSCSLAYGSGSTYAFCCVGICRDNLCQAELAPPPPPPCVASGQPCPDGCVPNGVCAGCCTGECTGGLVCGMFV